LRKNNPLFYGRLYYHDGLSAQSLHKNIIYK
jgi:hypothetical protein